MLHITNGDSAAGTLRAAGGPGTVLSWNDVLHEGPVPAGLPLADLSDLRARFVADCGWGACDQVRDRFAQRDEALARFREHDEVVLWFEHDLFDQLQLIQILDWLAARDRGATRLSLIVIGEFPGIRRFRGLGELNTAQMASLFPARREATSTELALGAAAWRAFTSADPRDIEALLLEDTSALPFLAGALRRHLEQFPALRNGLSRTERQILGVVAAGVHTRGRIFREEQEREERPFMGDASFYLHLDALAHARVPLLEPVDHQLLLSGAGRDVLAGREDHVRLNGIDRWLGGVHLQGADVWRWDGHSLSR